jgi:hypothetical protein
VGCGVIPELAMVFFTRNGQFLGFIYSDWLLRCSKIEGFTYLKEEGDMVRFNVGESVFATPPQSLGPILQLARGAQIDAAMLAGIKREQKFALFSNGTNSATPASVPNPVSNILLGKFSRDDSMGLSDVQANMHGLQAGYQAEIARIKKMHQEERGIMQAKIRNLVCNGPGTSAPSRRIPAIHTSASATLFDLGASGPVSGTGVGTARAGQGDVLSHVGSASGDLRSCSSSFSVAQSSAGTDSQKYSIRDFYTVLLLGQ